MRDILVNFEISDLQVDFVQFLVSITNNLTAKLSLVSTTNFVWNVSPGDL